MDEKKLNQALAYLGKKLDEMKVAFLAKNTTIDMGATTESIGKSIAKPLEMSIQALIAEVQKQSVLLNRNDSAEVARGITALQQELRNKKMEVFVEGQKISFEPVIAAIAAMNETFRGKKQDNTDILKALEALQKSIKIEVPKTDLKPIQEGLASMKASLDKVLAAIKENKPEKIGEKIDAMDAVFKGLKPKDTTRFDDEQMKGIMAALTHGGASMSTNPGVKSATNWEVARLAITAANTEYTYTFPANTVSWTMKLRDQGATLYYSSATGKFPTSGNNTTYMTMLPLGARSQDGVEWAGKKMYVQSDTASQVLEIEVFTL